MDTGKADDNETEPFAKGLPDWDLVPPQVTVREAKKANDTGTTYICRVDKFISVFYSKRK